jgi:tetratricopeptide (TPR) repeat protein
VALSKKVVPVESAVISLIAAIFLSVALTASGQTPAPDRRAEAERLANAGAYDAALKAFQAIAATNPDDIEARLWIARMHGKLGHPEHAADVYRSILAVQPQNLDALLGLGNALLALGRLREAGDALSRAEAIAADRPAVLTAQGRLHEAAHRTSLALAYYLRAIALDPSNTEARQAADALQALRAHRLELGYDFQRFPGYPGVLQDATREHVNLGTFELNGRVSDALRVFGRLQAQSAFDSDEQRAGGGIEWAVTRRAVLRAGILKGIDTLFLPDTDGFASASLLSGRARWSFDVQGAQFESADLWIFGPGLSISLPRSGEAFVRYYRGRVTTPFTTDAIATDSVALGIRGRVTRRSWAAVSYTHGIDRLDWLTLDRITFESDTISFRVGFDVTPFVGVEGGYDFQSRPEGINMHRAHAGLVYRF